MKNEFDTLGSDARRPSTDLMAEATEFPGASSVDLDTTTDQEHSDEAPRETKNDGPPSFNDFGLNQPIVEAIQKAGYSEPTEIQAKIIPHLLAGKDVVAQSQTGSGKTAAFALPLLSNLAKKVCRLSVQSRFNGTQPAVAAYPW